MPVSCEKVQTLTSQGLASKTVVYELCHDCARPAIQASRGQWLLAVRYGDVSSLDSQLFAAGAEKLIGLKPLSHFAPYRIGAEDRRDVIAERTLGLCKYLDHVLKCTEPPAPKFLVQIVDGFVTKYWAGNLERLLSTPAPDPPAEEEPSRRKSGLFSEFSRRVRPGEQMLETPPPLTNLKDAMLRRYAAAAVPKLKADLPAELVSLQQARPLAAREAAKAHTRPYLEVVPPSEVAADSCPLCRRHLRQKDTGCIRLRTCGHEVHGACFNDLISGSDRFRGFSRTGCPKCGELWAEPGCRSSKSSWLRPVLPEMGKVDE